MLDSATVPGPATSPTAARTLAWPLPRLDRATRAARRQHHPHHPWRAWGRMPDWTLVFTDDLPAGTWGRTLHAERRVLISVDLNQAERRCTAEHERQHALRGLVLEDTRAAHLAEELVVDRTVSRLLVPDVHRIGHALAWAGAHHDTAADELWVDPATLDVRLSTLTPAERAWLDSQLDTILV